MNLVKTLVKTVYGLDKQESTFCGSVLTIGNFDGVHRAHQQLIAQAGLFAANTGGPVVVLTFEPHPLTVVAPSKAPARLTTSDQKLHYLRKGGADVVVVAQSEPELFHMQAEQFVEDIIVGRFQPTHLVEGPSFGFGRDRRGNAELLRQLAPKFGFEVHIIKPVTLQIENGDALMVSSSLVRKLISEGKVRRAALCLGRPYTLAGPVVKGAQRGRTLGFPTANLGEVTQLLPADGVYAGVASVGDSRFQAAISIGATPTFGQADRRVEAHLLGFLGDLYGQEISIGFERRLRDQRTFGSPEDLVGQLRRDVEMITDEERPTP